MCKHRFRTALTAPTGRPPPRRPAIPELDPLRAITDIAATP